MSCADVAHAGNDKVLATVTAIIDGMGSVGAAIGPMVTGYISEMPGGFDNVFVMLYLSASCAGLLLIKLLIKETHELVARARGYVPHDENGTYGADGAVGGAADGSVPFVNEPLSLNDISSSEAFKYLPPGASMEREERTVDNETGRLV